MKFVINKFVYCLVVSLILLPVRSARLATSENNQGLQIADIEFSYEKRRLKILVQGQTILPTKAIIKMGLIRIIPSLAEIKNLAEFNVITQRKTLVKGGGFRLLLKDLSDIPPGKYRIEMIFNPEKQYPQIKELGLAFIKDTHDIFIGNTADIISELETAHEIPESINRAKKSYLTFKDHLLPSNNKPDLQAWKKGRGSIRPKLMDLNGRLNNKLYKVILPKSYYHIARLIDDFLVFEDAIWLELTADDKTPPEDRLSNMPGQVLSNAIKYPELLKQTIQIYVKETISVLLEEIERLFNAIDADFNEELKGFNKTRWLGKTKNLTDNFSLIEDIYKKWLASNLGGDYKASDVVSDDRINKLIINLHDLSELYTKRFIEPSPKIEKKITALRKWIKKNLVP